MSQATHNQQHKKVSANYTLFDEYGFYHLSHHLARRGRTKKLEEILLDFDWMVTKMYELVATQPLLDDYNLFSSPQGSTLASIRQTLTQNSQIRDGSPRCDGGRIICELCSSAPSSF